MVVHKKAVQQVLWGAGGVGAAESIVTGSDDGFLRLFDRRKLGDDADGCCVRKLDCGAAVADIELSRSADVLGTGKRVVTVAAGKVGLAFGVERGRGRIGRAKRCDQNKTRQDEKRRDTTKRDKTLELRTHSPNYPPTSIQYSSPDRSLPRRSNMGRGEELPRGARARGGIPLARRKDVHHGGHGPLGQADAL